MRQAGLLARLTLATLALVALGFEACSDNNEEPAQTPPATGAPATDTPVASVSPAAQSTDTPAAAAGTPAEGTTEVTGIVGVVDEAQAFIEITRLSGASVQRIEVTTETAIRRAGGGRIGLAEVQPSDRIIAQGELNERGHRLVATSITVQQVRPGASPGG